MPGVLALSEAGQRAASLGIAAAVAVAAWLVVLAVLALASRPDLPPAAPPSQNLGGPESPAVAGFLVNRWEVGREAVPATLLDLAARGAVTIDQVAPERFVVRVRGEARAPSDLTDYERQVLDHVRRLASAGVVPCEALTTGPENESEGWWNRFSKAVVADARARGLSRSRWSGAAIGVLAATAVVPALLAAGAFVAIPTDKSTSSTSTSNSKSDDNPIGAVLGLGVIAWGALMVLPFKLRAERHTRAGKEAAGRWLGLRDYLQDDEAFDRAPPSAVAIWDRYLAYGAAMGVAAGAVRALPLGSESDRQAWSSYGGKWHVVRVRYPQRIPPGWGQRPGVATAKGVLLLAAAAFAARAIGPPLAGAVGDFLDTSQGKTWHGWALVGLAVFGAMLAALALFLLRSLVMLVFAVPDLLSKQVVEGLVVRLRNGYLAVDDGQHPRVRAWRVEPAKLTGVYRGQVVRATTSPRLGHVFRIEPVGAAPQQAGLSPAPVPQVAIDLDALAASTGVRLERSAEDATVPGAAHTVVLSQPGGEGRVVVMIGSGAATGLVRLIGRKRAQAVDGVGDGTTARWSPERNILTVTKGDRDVTVLVALPTLDPDQRLALAKALAEAAH